MRTFIPEGTLISFESESSAIFNVTIDKLIGSGANCNVYEAHYNDSNGNPKLVRVKELYPRKAQIERNGLSLEWKNISEKQEAFEKFNAAYNKLSNIQNNKSTGNQTARAYDLYKQNNTCYIIMYADFGTTYDKTPKEDENLQRIIETCLVLSKHIRMYHNQGLLHLDIKPSNFLVDYNIGVDLRLFDVDTVTSINDIKSTSTFSYSEGYAAPELLQCQRNKIGEVTDIFAIGSILFERVMGREVQNEDMGIFSDWEFDGSYFDNVNPKIKRLLANIFKKTLSANVKRRYEKIDDLITDLEEALETVKQRVYLISYFPIATNAFVGRSNEINKIHDAYQSGRNIVTISGIGGIGKTELALRFINEYKKDFDAIIFLQYNGSLKESINDIQLEHYDPQNEREFIKELKSAFKRQKVLLVIDNFDNDGSDAYFGELLKLDCKLLITTRFDLSEKFSNIDNIVLSELDIKEQEDLFRIESGKEKFTDEEKREVHEILDIIEGYTLLIPLIAKQYKNNVLPLSEMTKIYRVEGIKNSSVLPVEHFKDGSFIKGNSYEILCRVLDVSNFSEDEKYVFRSVSAHDGISLKKIKLLQRIGKRYITVINDLKEKGWISFEGVAENTVIKMHKVISYLCRYELGFGIKNLPWIEELFRKVTAITSDYLARDKNGGILDKINRLQIKRRVSEAITIFKNLDKEDKETFIFIIESLWSNLKFDFNLGTASYIYSRSALGYGDRSLLESIINTKLFNKLKATPRLRCLILLNFSLCVEFFLSAENAIKELTPEGLLEHYKIHLLGPIRCMKLAEKIADKIPKEEKGKYLLQFILHIFKVVEYSGASIYLVKRHISLTPENQNDVEKIKDELETIFREHIEYVSSFCQTYFNENFPRNMFGLEDYLGFIDGLNIFEDPDLCDDDFIDEDIREDIEDEESLLNDENWGHKESIKRKFEYIFKDDISIDLFKEKLNELYNATVWNIDEPDEANEYYNAADWDMDEPDEANEYYNEDSEEYYNDHDITYHYNDEELDPLHELEELYKQEDIENSLLLNCAYEYFAETAKEECEEYSRIFDITKTVFLTDRLKKWYFDPLGQYFSYYNGWNVEKVCAVIATIERINIEKLNNDAEIANLVCAYKAVIYFLIGQYKKAADYLNKYADIKYLDMEVILQLYKNISDIDLANKLIRRCIDNLENKESESTDDKKIKLYLLHKYYLILGDKEKAKEYADKLNSIFDN